MTSEPPDGETDARARVPAAVLYLTVFVVATSGLVYELLAGTLASYVLGDSVFQFSTTIGTYLFAMGIGSFLSRYVKEDVAERFLQIELGAALAGGLSAPILFLGFAYADVFAIVLYGMVVLIGILVGLEVPLLMRILKERLELSELVARVLTFDYIGALVGSVLFAVVLVPELGLNRTSLLFGMLNAIVALVGTRALRELISARARNTIAGVAVIVLVGLGAAFAMADRLVIPAEQELYAETIVLVKQSPHQRIVLTQGRGGVQLFLDGNLQFAEADEYRYHEALVHPAFAATPDPRRVLVLGGGDGLALREIFKHPSVEAVTMVELDAVMTGLAATLASFRRLNRDAFADPRLTLVHDDAMVWLDEHGDERFDVIVVDFPDPRSFSLGKLYTGRFYALTERALAEDGTLVVQSTSPLYARRSYWCIDATIRAAGLHTVPFHATVPSFGEWGYVLAKARPFDPPERLTIDGLRFLNDDALGHLFVFPNDMARPADPPPPNRLDDQRLVRLYEEEWSRL